MDPTAARTVAISRSVSNSDEFFDAPTYSDWIRATMRAARSVDGAAVLFESTISEPTTDLVEIIRDAFSLRVTSRFVSAFDGGNPFTTEALCRRYGVEADRLIATTGATSAISMIVRALTAPGDHVLVECPTLDLLSQLVRDAGAIVEDLPRPAPLFRIDPETLRGKLTRRTRLVLITNLHNPSGALLSPSELQALAAVAGEVDALLVVDEVYADFAREAYSVPAAALAPNIITVNSLTKVFGLFALKCGWLIAQPEVVRRIRKAAPEGDLGVSKLAHAVAAHALESSEVFEAHWKRILASTRPVMRRCAKAMVEARLIDGEVPSYGCMYFPRVVGVEDTRALCKTLWREFGLLVAPGEYFGAPGHIRIGFGTADPQLEPGLERLGSALTVIRNAAR